MRRATLGWPALALLACSGDATSPAPEPTRPGINLVAGAGLTDTIEARVAALLRVRVLDAGGKPLARTETRFTSLSVDVAVVPFPLRNAFVQRVADTWHTDTAVDTTDADGYVSVRVVLGSYAGPAAIVVTVPTHAFADTARYTVLPGAPARSTISPEDTAVTVGATFSVVSGITDRRGNPVSGSPSLLVSGSALGVSSSGTVTTFAPVRAAIVASSGATRPDTTWVSVVPDAQMGAAVSGQLAVMQLDGRARRVIPTTLGASDPEWTLDGSALLAQLAPNSSGGSLQRVDLNAGVTPVPGVGRSVWGFAPVSDGSLLISAGGCNYMAILYRVPPGAASPNMRLSPSAADDCFQTVHHFPSPSPDGTRVVFEHRTSYFLGSNIRVLDPSTGTIVSIAATGERPRWSPRGDLIAFWDQNRIWVVAPNGSGLRAVSPTTHKYVVGVSWSPDGKWLLARYQNALANGTIVAVLEVETGMELPLTYTSTDYLNNFGVPVWRPVP